MRTLFLSLASLIFSQSLALADGAPVWLTPDLFISQAPMGYAPATSLATVDTDDPRSVCEAALTKAVCVTDKTTDQIARNWNKIQCEANSAQHVPALLEIYDEMPERMRPLYCSLSKIFLSDGIPSVAFASPIQRGEKMVGGFIGARLASFVNQPSAKELITWKEQLAYGGSKDFLSNDPALPQINFSSRMEHLRNDGLFYVMMHELGHLVDFQNGINLGKRARDWQRLSWSDYSTPRRGAAYKWQSDFCFYNCLGHLNIEQGYEVYESLPQSAFITTYSGMNSLEDFAEFWVWNILLEDKQGAFTVDIPGKPTIDLNSNFRANPKVQKKFEFIQKVWDNPKSKIGF